jgi:hypothetical protein
LNPAIALVLLGAALLVGGVLWTIQRKAIDPFARFRERLSYQALTASPAAILTETLDAVTDALGNAPTDAWLWEPGGMVRMTARGAGHDFPMPEVNPWAGVGDPSSPIAFLLTFGPAGMIRVGRSTYSARARDAAKAMVPAITAALEAAFLRQKQDEEIEALKARLDSIEKHEKL